jgi:competence protein ComEC
VLGPRTLLHGTDSDPNNASLVMRVQLPGLSLLLTGDAELPLQDQLLAGAPLHADVLKVPHHGSDRQQPAFLADVQARAAIVSVGAGNSYGHPSPRTIDLLTHAGAAVFRTDTGGAIAVFRARSGMVNVVPRGEREVSAHTAARPAGNSKAVRGDTGATTASASALRQRGRLSARAVPTQTQIGAGGPDGRAKAGPGSRQGALRPVT